MSEIIGQIPMNFCEDTEDPQRIYPEDFGNCLIFLKAPTTG